MGAALFFLALHSLPRIGSRHISTNARDAFSIIPNIERCSLDDGKRRELQPRRFQLKHFYQGRLPLASPGLGYRNKVSAALFRAW